MFTVALLEKFDGGAALASGSAGSVFTSISAGTLTPKLRGPRVSAVTETRGWSADPGIATFTANISMSGSLIPSYASGTYAGILVEAYIFIASLPQYDGTQTHGTNLLGVQSAQYGTQNAHIFIDGSNSSFCFWGFSVATGAVAITANTWYALRIAVGGNNTGSSQAAFMSKMDPTTHAFGAWSQIGSTQTGGGVGYSGQPINFQNQGTAILPKMRLGVAGVYTFSGATNFAAVVTAALSESTNILLPTAMYTPATYQINPATGADTNNGIDSPWKTITKFNSESASSGLLPVPDPANLTPTALTCLNSIATVTVANSYSVGQRIIMWGWTTTNEFNGAFTVLSASSTQFTVAITTPNPAAAGIGTGKCSTPGNGDTLIIDTATSRISIPNAGLIVQTHGINIQPAATQSSIDFQAEIVLPNNSFSATTSDGAAHTLTKVYQIAHAYTAATAFGNDRMLFHARGSTLGGTSTDNGAMTVGQYLDATPGSFFADGTNLYIHPNGDTNPTTDGKVFTASQRFGGNSSTGVNMNAIQLGCRNWRFNGAKIQKTMLYNPSDNDPLGAYCIGDSGGHAGVCLLENANTIYGSKHNIGYTTTTSNSVVITQNCIAEQGQPYGSTTFVSYMFSGSGNTHYYVNCTCLRAAAVANSLAGAIAPGSPYAGAHVTHGGASVYSDLRFIGCNYVGGGIVEQGSSLSTTIVNGVTTDVALNSGTSSVLQSTITTYFPSITGGGLVQNCILTPSYNNSSHGAAGMAGTVTIDHNVIDTSGMTGTNTALAQRVANCLFTFSYNIVIGGATPNGIIDAMIVDGSNSVNFGFNIYQIGTSCPVVTNFTGTGGASQTFAQWQTSGHDAFSVNRTTLNVDSQRRPTTQTYITATGNFPLLDFTGTLFARRKSIGAYEFLSLSATDLRSGATYQNVVGSLVVALASDVKLGATNGPDANGVSIGTYSVVIPPSRVLGRQSLDI